MADPVVWIETDKGTIKAQIFLADVPNTAQNFLDLVNKGFYNGLTFHRHEPGFCLQGGCPKGTGTGGSEPKIKLEINRKYSHKEKGMMAMARTDDPNSASCQFYFTLGDAAFLDGNYAIFGKLIEGMDVLDQLRKGDKMNNVKVGESVRA